MRRYSYGYGRGCAREPRSNTAFFFLFRRSDGLHTTHSEEMMIATNNLQHNIDGDNVRRARVFLGRMIMSLVLTKQGLDALDEY
jgi:hypothetical protein